MELIAAGVHVNIVLPLLHTGLIRISHSRFTEQSRSSLLISQFYAFFFLVNFAGDSWAYLGGDSFTQRIGNISKK